MIFAKNHSIKHHLSNLTNFIGEFKQLIYPPIQLKFFINLISYLIKYDNRKK